MRKTYVNFYSIQVVIMVLVLHTNLIAQQSIDYAPNWFKYPPSDTRNYIYLTGLGENANRAEMDLMNNISSKIGCIIDKPNEYHHIELVTINNSAMEKGSYGTTVFKTCSKAENVSWKIETSEFKNGVFYILAKVDVINTRKAILLSLFPGVGHFPKREPIAGAAFMASTLGSTLMTAYSLNQKNFNSRQINLTRDTEERKEFIRLRDTWEKRTLTFGVLSGILYGANIAHAGFFKKEGRLYSDNSTFKNLDVKPVFAFNQTGISFIYMIN